MLKKAFLSGALLAFIFLAGGCGTLCKGASGLAQGVKVGAKEDWDWLAKHADNADGWVKTNLW